MICRHCGQDNNDANAFCIRCGQALAAPAPPLSNTPLPTYPTTPQATAPPPPPPYMPYAAQMPPTPAVSDPVENFIPYKNALALTSYYLGVFSLIPCLGFFLGIAAIITGQMGLNHHKAHPETKGKAHAVTGLVLGSMVVTLHLALIIWAFLASRPPNY